MADDQSTNENSLEGFVPEQETPVVETPPDPVVPDAQDTVEETPATPDSEKVTAEETSGKTVDQIKEDAAHWQTQYQKAMAELDQVGKSTDFVGQPDQEQESESVTQKAPADDLSKYDAMSDEELEDLYRDDPVFRRKVDRAQNLRDMESIVDKRLSKMEKDQQFRAEKTEANLIFNDFLAKNKVAKEEVDTVTEKMKSMGFKAKPAAVAKFMIEQIVYGRVMNGLQAQQAKAVADVSKAAKTQALTIQPAGNEQASPEAQTYEDIVGSKFKPSKASEALSPFFG